MFSYTSLKELETKVPELFWKFQMDASLLVMRGASAEIWMSPLPKQQKPPRGEA
jgi:hypothetical protein